MKRYYITLQHFECANSIDGEPSEEFLREYFSSLEILSWNSAVMPARDVLPRQRFLDNRTTRVMAPSLCPSLFLSLKTGDYNSDRRIKEIRAIFERGERTPLRQSSTELTSIKTQGRIAWRRVFSMRRPVAHTFERDHQPHPISPSLLSRNDANHNATVRSLGMCAEKTSTVSIPRWNERSCEDQSWRVNRR
jgi:hypothetical protein